MAIPYDQRCKKMSSIHQQRALRGLWADPKIRSKSKEESLVMNLKNSNYRVIFA